MLLHRPGLRPPDSNALRHVLFGYRMNKLQIFEVLIITSLKV
jgi:hypothetical protein